EREYKAERRDRFILTLSIMDFLYLFGLWISVLQISFVFIPLTFVLEWRKRGSTEGFSAVMLILPFLIMSCWMRFGLMTEDTMMVVTNGIMLATSCVYLSIFISYTKDRTIVYSQIAAVLVSVVAVFAYVSSLNPEDQIDRMGAISGIVQNLRLIGALYQIKMVIDTKTTEYVPYTMQFIMIFFVSQMTLYAILSGNFYMAVGSIPGVILCVVNISLYIIYPPITWRVPILGVQKKVEKSE
ncbi:hypothetical protein PRIPAC_76827, partial [Pristionchus pacificus]